MTTIPRTGIGYDCHRFAAGRRLVLGGVEIPHDRGLEGHSDADVLTHAIIDALLGAAALGDIGDHFPDTDERYRNADSLELLAATVATLAVISVLVAALDLYVWLGVNTSSDFTPAMAWVPLLSILIMASAWGLYLISPFVCMALKWKYAKSLVFAPVYVCWKSIVALTGRPKQWVRTRRR